MLKYNDISMNPFQAMVLENRMPDRINNQNGMSPTEGEMCRVGSLPDAAMMTPSSGMSPSEQCLSPAEGISPPESDVSSPNGLGARTGAPVSLAANETRAASAQALYDTIRPEKTVWDKADQVVAGRPTHTTTWSDGDAITQQKQAAMQRYSHVPQWIFDLAEKKARTGESVGISDILAAALSGAGWGASQALTKGVALSMQGVNDSYANPVGLAQRAINATQGNGFEVMMPTVEADGIAERALTESAHYLTDGLPVSRTLSTAVKAVKPIAKAAESANVFVRTPARVVQTLAEPLPVGYEITGLMGAAGLTTALEPETTWGQIATGTIGGMAAPLIMSAPAAVKGLGQMLYEQGVKSLTDFKDARQIAQQYKALKKNPLRGNADDVMATIHIENEDPVTLKRGAAIVRGKDTITSGNILRSEAGTRRNYGLNKAIYKHDLSKGDVKKLPKILRQYKPADVSTGGKKIYVVQDEENPLVVVTSPTSDGWTVVSMYRETRNPERKISSKKELPRSRMCTYQAHQSGYTAGDSSLRPAGGEASDSITSFNSFVKGEEGLFPFMPGMVNGGLISGGQEVLSHDVSQEGAPVQPAAELIQFPASPNVRNDTGRILNIDYPNAVVKGGEETSFTKVLPRSRTIAGQAGRSGYTAGDSSFVPAGGEANDNITSFNSFVKGGEETSFTKVLPRSRPTAWQARQIGYKAGDFSLRPAGGEADQEIAYFTPSVKRENEITSSCVGSPAQEPLTAVSDLLTYDIDPTGAEALLDAGLDEKEILSRHRAYDMSLSEVTAQRILGSDAASSRLKALKETLSGMLPGLKEASRRQGHRFYSEAPSVQSRLLEEAYLTAMGASADDVSVPEAHRLMGQGRKEAAYGVHGGPYYQDDLSDFWHMIAAV